jgi:hypothetical protein
MTVLLVILLLTLAAFGGSGRAYADSSPIGALPAGPLSSIEAQRGELVAVAVPQRGGTRFWRVARPIDSGVLRQVSEARIGSSVVLIFRATDRHPSYAPVCSDRNAVAVLARDHSSDDRLGGLRHE